MAINDTVQLAVEGTVAGQTHIHTLHFRYVDLLTSEQDLIDQWQATCRTAYRALFETGDSPCKLYRASQVCGSIPLRAPVEEAEAVGNQTGTATPGGERAPSWLAAVVSLRTAFAGKSRRGRFYIGGLWEPQIVFNSLTAAYQTTLNAYVTALLANFKLGGAHDIYQLVVYSRKLASVPGTQCVDSSTLITSALVNAEIGTMKSRKPGSGT